MDRRALASLVERNEAAAWSFFASIAPAVSRRYGFAAVVRAGVLCASCRATPISLVHRAIGFGTLAPPTRSVLDAIVRHYARLGLPARVELAEGIAPSAAERLLERSGFKRENYAHHVHVRDAGAPPPPASVAGLRIVRVRRSDAAGFARLLRAGFELEGDLGDLFELIGVAVGRRAPVERVASLQGVLDGSAAATGVLFVAARVGGLYSGSVLPAFRGRGIQSAMIAARVRYGWERGLRIFASQTVPDGPSQRNLHDAGFRTLYRSSFFVRPA